MYINLAVNPDKIQGITMLLEELTFFSLLDTCTVKPQFILQGVRGLSMVII